MSVLKEKDLENKRTILVVDDEEINRDIISSFLEGYPIETQNIKRSF